MIIKAVKRKFNFFSSKIFSKHLTKYFPRKPFAPTNKIFLFLSFKVSKPIPFNYFRYIRFIVLKFH